MPKVLLNAYKVEIKQRGGAVVAEKEFTAGPGNDASTVNYKYGGHDWTHVFVRQKTNEGDVFVTARYQGNSLQHASADPEHPAQIQQPDGSIFDITVTKVDRAVEAEAVAFDPPKAIITADAAGWTVTFEPKQYPCVLTVAMQEAMTKDENLPSFPFPSNPRYSRASFHIPAGQFGATEGAEVRLGIRGAGREALAKLPKPGETVTIEPKQFKVKGPGDAQFLSEAYVTQKFNEKAQLIQYEA
jgi:hypothetical protein